MYLPQHNDACFKRWNNTYEEIHKFLDQYQEAYVDNRYAHRRLLHHSLGVELVVKAFGEEARKAADLHIRQDIYGMKVQPSEEGQLPKDWTFYNSIADVQRLDKELLDRQNRELRILYGDEVFGKAEAGKI
ncbi:DUF6915 family protein [Thermodesulfobacteriota bacterium]